MRTFSTVLTILALQGCGTESEHGKAAHRGAMSGDISMSAAESSDAGSDDQGSAQQGAKLTSGAWDDNDNYDWFVDYLDSLAQLGGQPRLDAGERDEAHQHFGGDRPPNTAIDIALVVDTTGSMGDELDYLTAELSDIAAAIDGGAANADVRWALVAYRDQGDAYVTRPYDFTRQLGTFQDRLADQKSAGGGDTPEASDAALQDTVALSWRTRPDVARIAFWITDAPHHIAAADDLTDAIRDAVDDDIHLYPIAASGVDDLAELTMRSAAQVTGGRYLFLTDDSGIGDDHKEPTIPCYIVTTLADAMVRMVEIEHSGVHVLPEPADVLRTSGHPRGGQCSFEGGAIAYAF